MSEEIEAGNGGTLINRLLWTFQSPKKLYADIEKETAHWWQPWVWVSRWAWA